MTRTLTLTLTIALSACASRPPVMLDRVTACEAQASAWCPKSGMDSPGCPIVYLQLFCAHVDLDRGIPDDMQDACLTAIADTPAPMPVPAACMATWAMTPETP